MINILQNHSRSLARFGLTVTAALAFIGMSAQQALAQSVSLSGNVIQLTGGDPSGGLTLNPADVVYALYTPVTPYSGPLGNLTTGGTQLFQGVTFSATNGNIVRGTSGGEAYLYHNSPDTGTPGGNAGFTNAVNTTEDNNLLALMNAGLDFSSNSDPVALTLTISNLTPNTNYQFDTLISLLGFPGARTGTVAYNGGAVADTITYPSPNSIGINNIYDVRDTVESNGSGQIVVDYSGNQGPFYSALVVSNIPEPSTYAMALGGLGMLLGLQKFRRRRA